MRNRVFFKQLRFLSNVITFDKLRPYQKQCIDTCLEAFQNGNKKQVVSLPVG